MTMATLDDDEDNTDNAMGRTEKRFTKTDGLRQYYQRKVHTDDLEHQMESGNVTEKSKC